MDDALYLFNIGQNYMAYKFLGSHKTEQDGKQGFRFAVWAPRAKYVAVSGDFNDWDTSSAPLTPEGSTGIWEGFVPGAQDGQCYKYYIEGQNGQGQFKTDPYARKTELRPNDASVLLDDEPFEWTDKAFLEKRRQMDFNASPINIYEMHLSSWRTKEDGSYYTYEEMAPLLADYIKEMGYTHIELMPVMEYPFDGSWGYQVTGYFSPTARHGDKKGFQYFVNHLHENNIGVLLDWVPAHYPRDAHGLAYFDGSPCYEYADKRMGEHADWGTLVFDYGKAEVRSFLMSSAVYWLDEFHIDGLRVDAVSSMIYRNYGRTEYIPNKDGGTENYEAVEFLTELNKLVHREYPGVMMIAEESTAWPKVTHKAADGGMEFDMKWDMGWMHDTLNYFSLDYLYRKHHHNEITFSMLYNFHERFLLALSHDEVVHGKASLINKMPGDFWRKFASLRELFLYMMGHPGGKLVFMGAEIGQFIEWRYYEQLEWFLLEYDMHEKLHNYVKTLNHMYLDIPAFWEDDRTWEGFSWLNADDSSNSVYSWARKDKNGGYLVFILNMTPAVLNDYKFPAPRRGRYKILLNSDASHWGGSDYPILVPYGQEKIHEKNKALPFKPYSWDPEKPLEQPAHGPNGEGCFIDSRDIGNHGYPQSLRLNLPPLAGVVLQLVKEDESKAPEEAWPDPEMPYPDKYFVPVKEEKDEPVRKKPSKAKSGKKLKEENNGTRAAGNKKQSKAKQRRTKAPAGDKAKTAEKAAAKTTAKTTAKSATKTAAKTAAKAPAKTAAKAAAESKAKTAAGKTAKAAVKEKAKDTAKDKTKDKTKDSTKDKQ